jgi:hypothetical protein
MNFIGTTGMRKLFPTLLFIGVIPMATAAPNFTTPEGAVKALEAAYANKSIEDAVAAKNFNAEARLMLLRIQPELARDAEVLKQMAEVLELSFRKQIDKEGFPDVTSFQCSLSRPEQVSETLVKMTETCRSPEGVTSLQDLHVSKDANGWRVVVVAS